MSSYIAVLPFSKAGWMGAPKEHGENKERDDLEHQAHFQTSPYPNIQLPMCLQKNLH